AAGGAVQQRPAGAAQRPGDRAGGRVLDRDRPVLRLLPGAQGQPARSDRGPAPAVAGRRRERDPARHPARAWMRATRRPGSFVRGPSADRHGRRSAGVGRVAAGRAWRPDAACSAAGWLPGGRLRSPEPACPAMPAGSRNGTGGAPDRAPHVAKLRGCGDRPRPFTRHAADPDDDPSRRCRGHGLRPVQPGRMMADETGHLPRRPSRILKAAVWSLQGLRAAWLHESSFRLEVYLLVVLAPAALWLGQDGIERALLLGSCLLVLAVELLNSAIEAVIERFGSEHHELSGRAKDMGSAAVCVTMLNVVLVWGLVLVPRWLS